MQKTIKNKKIIKTKTKKIVFWQKKQIVNRMNKKRKKPCDKRDLKNKGVYRSKKIF